MGRERDDYSGRFTRQYSDADFIQALEELESSSTSTVASHLGCSSNLAYRRLAELAEEGRVGSEDVAGNYRWFVIDGD
jgi:AraC-like DNA-binding protein